VVILAAAVSACGAQANDQERTVRVRLTCEGDPAAACAGSQAAATQKLIESLRTRINYFLYKAAEPGHRCGLMEIKVSRTNVTFWNAEIFVYKYRNTCSSPPEPKIFLLDLDKTLNAKHDDNGLNAVTKEDFPQLLATSLRQFIDIKGEDFARALREAIPVGFGATFTIPPASAGQNSSSITGIVVIKPLPNENSIRDPDIFAWAAYNMNALDVSLPLIPLQGKGCRLTNSGLEVDLAESRNPPAAWAEVKEGLAKTKNNAVYLFTQGDGSCQSGVQPQHF
jgi:hypothetical protein